MNQCVKIASLDKPSAILKFVLSPRNSRAEYVLAFGVAAISLGIAKAASVHAWGLMYTVPFAGAVLTAVFFGLGQALFCSVISALGLDYWVIGNGTLSNPPVVIGRVFVFTVMTIVVSRVISELRKGYVVAEFLKTETERQVILRQQVVDIVSHDLRNPIASVQMYASLLLTDPSAKTKKFDSSEALHGILRSAERMKRITGDLLSASQIESGKFSIKPGIEGLNEMIYETLDAFRQKAKESHVAIDFTSVGEETRIDVDRLRFIQALSNLVDNAIKFSPECGQVRIRSNQENGMLFISVTDQGPGISPEAMPHIFERYWTEAKRSAQGTGLGLFIARGIARSHGGDLTVANNPEGGAIFTMTISASRAQALRVAG